MWLVLIIFMIPIAGIYLLLQRDSGTKVLGAVLTILGFAIWIILGMYLRPRRRDARA